jgi:hypothetical protein
MTKVAARFHISDVGLRKRCVKHRIPVPGRGYWRQLETGKRPQPVPLPKVKDAPRIAFDLPYKSGESPPVSTIDPVFAAYEATHPIVVPDELSRPHAATKAMSRDFKGQKADDYGAIRSKGTDTFQVRIHPASTERALRLVDTLAKAFHERGFEFCEGKAGSRYSAHLSVRIDGGSFSPSIDERMRRVPYRMTEAELARQRKGQYVYTPNHGYQPTGEFTLKLDGGYGSGVQSLWKDSRHQKVEARLNDVMISLRALADYRLEEKRKAEERKARYDIIQRARADLRQRIADERKALDTLETEATAWDRAEKLRAYITAVETQCAANGTLDERAEWLDWARRQVDRLDPLRASPPSILDTPEEEFRAFGLWQMSD